MLRWFPWRYVVSRVARARGLVDPVRLLSRLESFAQPLEVKEPLELLRAGMVFHARGLLNTNAIQHNLDWVWPYWVERQYDPRDPSFIPRAFSITHVNLTHRNWTAVGVPDGLELPIVDPRGLVTPFWDGWSLDAWVVADDGRRLIPSRLPAVEQHLEMRTGVAVRTEGAADGLRLTTRAEVRRGSDGARLELDVEADAGSDPGWLVVALRPYNPEGVSFVHDLAFDPQLGWSLGEGGSVRLDPPPRDHRLSGYRQGDVWERVGEPPASGGAIAQRVHCPVGMATAAARYRLERGAPARVRVGVPLDAGDGEPAVRHPWEAALEPVCRLRVPDRRLQFLWDAAVRTVILHAPGEEAWPGPYTYRRFWFRDSAFIVHALLTIGLTARAERVIATFPRRQTRRGHFLSQEGEWDSNGQVLWLLERFRRLVGRLPIGSWGRPVARGARWLGRMRVRAPGEPHDGLLPAGFSAEHLGPNDYYYWDDFWAIAGLRAAAALAPEVGRAEHAERWRREADELSDAVDLSLGRAAARLGRPAMPAAPSRRLDSGAIGSLCVGYPVALWPGDDRRLLDTADYLMAEHRVRGGFFQDMIHSGINPYLTLHLAQVLLRAGDSRFRELLAAVAELASPTGQWPEAVHPRTLGGCMGDGQHAWAAGEWLLFLRNLLVLEEPDLLVLGAGLDRGWVEAGTVALGPAPTPWGPVEVSFEPREGGIVAAWSGRWRGEAPQVEVRVPGLPPIRAVGATGEVVLAGVPA